MSPRGHLAAAALLVLALAGCERRPSAFLPGGGAGGEPGCEPELEEPLQPAPPLWYVGSARRPSLGWTRLLAVSPDTGGVESLVELTGLDCVSTDILSVARDRRHAVLAPEGGSVLCILEPGAPPRQVVHERIYGPVVSASSGMELFAFADAWSDRPGGACGRALVDAKSGVVWSGCGEVSCAGDGTRAYVPSERGVVRISPDGSATSLVDGPAYVHLLPFATSIVAIGEKESRWYDLAGGELSVPGFAPAGVLPRGPWQIADGWLWRLADRVVERVVPVAEGDWKAVVRAGPRGALLRTSRSSLVLTGVGGAIRRRLDAVPPPAELAPAGAGKELETAVSAWTFTAVVAWSFTASTGLGERQRFTLDLWDLGCDRLDRVHETAATPHGLRFSSDGRFLLWLEGDVLHRLDMRTRAVATIAPEIAFLPAVDL